MNILFVASECAPFIKTGGLADVIGAVPKVLAEGGSSVKVMIPAYRSLASLVSQGRVTARFDDLFGGAVEIVEVTVEGIDLVLVDAPHLYDREGSIYLGPGGQDWHDNDLRFAALSFSGAHVAAEGLDGWRPDVVNAHDWQAALLPAYLRQSGKTAPPVVMTIHNIAFQGVFDATRLSDLWLRSEMFTQDGVEFYGKISFLKAGLAMSEAITTVSPSYACELLTPEFGMGMEGLLQARRADLSGILNGIDLDVWNPETDPHLTAPYGLDTLGQKAANKAEVQARFGLNTNDGPLFCVVSRLTSQKGLDMLLACLPDLVAQGGKLALLGTGERDLERAFVDASNRYSGSVGVIIGYDEALSHLMQGGSDAILIPSRFEPCGLTQLYGLRYGTLPVVARTGGLADSIIDANEAALAADCATGFQFAPINATMFGQAITRACDAYRQPEIWSGMMKRAMRHPVGWDQSAAAYNAIYASLTDARD